MKRVLRQGDYKALNVYFVVETGKVLNFLDSWNEVSGPDSRAHRNPQFMQRCPFPEDVKEGSGNFILDGCVVVGGSLPGGTKISYNLGTTLVHEVGHYLSNAHLPRRPRPKILLLAEWTIDIYFLQGRCSDGDLVDDTPTQFSPTSGCRERRNTCAEPGDDPIHNYMDYSSE